MDDAAPAVASALPSTPAIPMLHVGRFRLPERLRRPEEKLIPDEILKAINEELAEVPLDYIKDTLLEDGPE